VSFKQIATQKLKSLPEKNKLISPDTRTISKRTITHCFHKTVQVTEVTSSANCFHRRIEHIKTEQCIKTEIA